MKPCRIASAVLLPVALFAACALPQGGGGGAGERFEALVSDYFEWSWRTHPIRATGVGIHAFDDRLDETGPDAVQAEIEELRGFLDRMAALDARGLDRDQRLDRILFSDRVKGRLFEMETLKVHSRSPQEYMARLGAGLMPLLDLNGDPLPGCRAGLIERLEQVPAFLEGARSCLANPPALHTQVAIERCRGLERLAASISGKAGGTAGKGDGLRAGAGSAMEALSQFRRFLEEELLPRSTGDYRLGEALYGEAFRAAYCSAITPDELLDLAEQEIDRVQREMYDISSKLFPKLFQGRPAGPGEASSKSGRARITREVIRAVSGDHPSPEAYADAIQESLDEIRRFIRNAGILDLPEPDLLTVAPMPEYARGASIAYFEPAPVFGTGQRAFYRYSPVPEDWPAERRESFMREYNEYTIRIFAIHEAIPGHYVYWERASRHPSLVRRLFGNGAAIEGWAVYCEHMMLEAGFGGGDPRLELMQRKWYLRSVANAIVDIRLHTRGMSDGEVLRFLREEAFQEEAEARHKLRRAKLSHVQLTMYFMGFLQMRALRRAAEERWNASFSLKRFHDAVLGYGALPLELIREDMAPGA
jgi:hypothetical protein